MKVHCTRLKYASDKTFKEKLQIWFVKDHRKAIKFRIFNLTLRVATCILYIVEVLLDPYSSTYLSSTTSSSQKYSSSSSSSDNNRGDLSKIASIHYGQQQQQQQQFQSFDPVSLFLGGNDAVAADKNSNNLTINNATIIGDPFGGMSEMGEINWQNIVFVRRHPIVRYLQLIFAVYGFFETFFYFYLCYNVIFY